VKIWDIVGGDQTIKAEYNILSNAMYHRFLSYITILALTRLLLRLLSQTVSISSGMAKASESLLWAAKAVKSWSYLVTYIQLIYIYSEIDSAMPS
jgi:hypothetical protein